MDVGNDLFYGVPVAQVLLWLDECLARLVKRAADVAVAGLPLARLRRLQPWQYEVFRRVMVPSCRLDLAEGLRQAHELHDGLAVLARQHGARFVPVDEGWYGIDPIHLRRRQWPAAAAHLVGARVGDPTAGLDGPVARLALLVATPSERTWFGRPQCGQQPARRFADGTTLSLW